MTIIQVQTHVRCDGCGAESPAAAGIVRARVLAREKGWKADGSRKPDLCDKCIHREAAIEKYKQLAIRVGTGFHPDTPFSDYVPPIDWMTEGEFEAIMDDAFGLKDFDPYNDGVNWAEGET